MYHGGGAWGPYRSGPNGDGIDDEDQLGSVYSHEVVKRLVPYLARHKRDVILAVAGMVAFTIASVAMPWLIQIAIDRYILPGDFRGLLLFTAFFMAIGVLGAIGQRVEALRIAYVGQGIIYDLRMDLFRHLQRLSMRFWDRSRVGRVMSRVTNDVNQVQEVMTTGLVGSLAQLLTLVGMVAVMLRMDVVLALATLIGMPVLFAIASVWQRYARVAFVRVRAAIAIVNGTLQENVSGARTVQSMRREDRNMDEFDDVNRRHLDANVRAARLSGIMSFIVEVQSALALGVVVVVGGWRVLLGLTTPGEMVAFFLFAQRFFEPIRMIIEQYTGLQRAMAGGIRIFDLLDTQPDVKDKPDAIEMPPIRGEVAFHSVTFAYVPGQPVLQDITVTINPGEAVALVGPTGAGKTSFVNLVGRLYEVAEGSITIDGMDIRDVRQQSLARQMGVVLQDPFLFSGTVKENILFGRPDASDEEVERAARAVDAHAFIARLDHGYETHLAERGSNLSVGQRQLISFARALLADPRILILDEATANIDTQTEVLIQDALGELLQGRTSIVIAHRLSTIRNADKIIVLDGGRIREMGTHEELLAQGGLYARLYTMTYLSANGAAATPIERAAT